MLINKAFWKSIGAIVGVGAIIGVIVGGYFAISQLDKYRSYYVTPSNDTSRGFIDAYKNAVYNGAKVLLTPGFTHKDPIIQSFKEYGDFFADTGLMLFDEAMSATDSGAYNTWSITFRSDLGSIQTGIAMCMFLNYYQDVFYKDGKLSYGIYGGLPYSSVTSFMGGIQHGVEWFNQNVAGKDSDVEINNQVVSINFKPIEWVKSDIGDFAGGFGPSQGTAISNHLITKNIDVLVPVAGPQTWTAMDQIMKLNYECVLLGVDSAMEEDALNSELDFKSKYGQIGNGKYVQFSSLKDLSKATYRALQIVNNGNIIPEPPSDVTDPNERANYFKNFSETGAVGEISGFGTMAVGNIENQCVGVSTEGQPYLDKALEITGLEDPALDAFYSQPENMYWTGSNGTIYNYGEAPFGLNQNFKNLFADNPTDADKILNLKDFIQPNEVNATSKIKVVLSTTTSVLMDSSFSQSCYMGMVEFYKSLNYQIPSPANVLMKQRRIYEK